MRHNVQRVYLIAQCLCKYISYDPLVCPECGHKMDELRKMGTFPKEEELKKLLLWSDDFPEYCRTKLKNNTKPSDRASGRQPGTVSDGFYKMSIYG